jgi:methionyl-tRNA formyltransferase
LSNSRPETTTKIALCAANYVGSEIMSFVAQYPFNIEFAATCHTDDSIYEKEIADVCATAGIECFRNVNVNEDSFVALLKQRGIDIVILAWWPTIVKSAALSAVNIGWINHHNSLLPHNRGKHPYYWSIVENRPYGVTLHFIDENIDEGQILTQKELPVSITDTGESIYNRSISEIIQLFQDFYPQIISGNLQPFNVPGEPGSFHWASEIEEHSCIDLDAGYTAIDLINIMRARTFTNGNSAYFWHDGKKYLIKLTIQEA